MDNLRNHHPMSINICSFMLCAVLIAAPASALVGDVLITFESVPGITTTASYPDGSPVPTGARLTTQLQLSDGLTFSSTAGYVALVRLGSGHATSGINGIGGVNTSNVLKYNQPVIITFTMPGSPSIPAITDYVSIRGDQLQGAGSATIQAFDVSGAPIGNATAADVSGGLTLSLAIPNIHSIRLTQTRSDIAFDDLRFNSLSPATSERPTANAGSDQHMHSGQAIILDGGGSSDDNTATDDLIFEWTLIGKPDGSAATLVNANTMRPQFVADVPGEYVASLIVADSDGLMSDPDTVVVSSLNTTPVADAGADQGVFVGQPVTLDGSASYDSDSDLLEFSWTLSAPDGSVAALSGGMTASPTFTPDVAGSYTATLRVNDPFGEVSVDNVVISAITTGQFAGDQIAAALNLVGALTLGQVTTRGNRQALQNLLTQAIAALRVGDLDEARSKLMQAIERIDGCVLRGSPDGNGSGRDWVIDCAAQASLHQKLTGALVALQ